MNAQLKKQLILGLLLLIIPGPVNSNAGSAVNVGVAANFAPALELIGTRFTAETGIAVQLTISSSGRLFSQIRNQAPLDLYLSADTQRPEMLYEKGFC
jgi:molybdate transport system substrate-binding protein